MTTEWREYRKDGAFDLVERRGANVRISVVEQDGQCFNTHFEVEFPIATLVADGPTPQILGWTNLALLGRVARELDATAPLRWLTRTPAEAELLTASLNNDLEAARRAIAAGASVETASTGGYTVLGNAAGHAPAVALALLDAGADPKRRYQMNDRTPLHAAVCAGHTDVVRALLAKGAVADARTTDGATPLFAALLERVRSRLRNEPQQHVIGVEIVRALAGAGADLNAVDTDGWTILMRAVSTEDRDLVACMLDAGADVHARNAKGSSVLVHAINGCTESNANRSAVCELLIARGADVDTPDADGQTPLAAAIKNEHARLEACLRQAGARDPVVIVPAPIVLPTNWVHESNEASARPEPQDPLPSAPRPSPRSKPERPLWLLGQRVEIGADQIVITLDRRIRALFALPLAGGIALIAIGLQFGSLSLLTIACAVGFVLAWVGVRELLFTQWSCPARIAVSPTELAVGARIIPASKIRSIAPLTRRVGKTPTSMGDQVWSLSIELADHSSIVVPIVGRRYAVSAKPFEELVVAINRMLGSQRGRGGVDDGM